MKLQKYPITDNISKIQGVISTQKLLSLAIVCTLNGAIALSTVTPFTVYAQEIDNASSSRYTVSIPAGKLSDVLAQFAARTGVPLSFNPSMLAGIESNGLQGSYRIKEGFALILAGTDYQLIEKGEGSYSLRRTSKEITMLPTVEVSAGVMEGADQDGYVVSEISGAGPWSKRNSQDIPYSITVTPKDLIANSLAGDMDQIYKMNPIVQNSAPTTVYATPYVAIRGFHSQKGVLDGIRLSSTSVGINVEELESVEIMNGLTGFLYGAGNPGGTTNYVLKRPTYEKLLDLTVGNYGDRQWFGHIDIGNKIDDEGKFAYRLNLVYQNGETGKEEQNVKKELISGAIDWNITNNFLVQLEAAHSYYKVDKLDSRFYAYGDSNYGALGHWLTPPSNAHTYTPDWTFLETETDRVGINAKYTISDSFNLRAAYLYKIDTLTQMGMYPAYFADSGWQSAWNYNGAPYDNLSQGAYVYLDSVFNTAGLIHKLTIGVSGDIYEQNVYENDYISGANSPSYDSVIEVEDYLATDLQLGDYGNKYTASRTSNSNIIIGDDILFNEQWSALLGLNITSIKSKKYNAIGDTTADYDESALTPTISVIYKPFDALTTYVSYMEGLEAGTTVTDNPDEYNNPGEILEPYVSKQYEVATKYLLSENLQLNSALFRIEKANSYNERTSNGKITVNQDGQQVNQGLELTVTGKITDNLTIIAGGSLMDLNIEKATNSSLEGKKPTGAASKLAKIYIEYDIKALKGLTLTWGAYYTGEKYKDSANEQEIDAYTIYDAGVRYKTNISSYPTILRLNVANLTDKNYWATTYSLGIPRTIAFSMNMKF